MYRELHDLLLALDGVAQPARYHPEGDALFHSLQVFELARRESSDRVLWAAALLHDVGKAEDGRSHDCLGAELLEELVCPRIVWLVRHHLDLLREPRLTRRRLRGTSELHDLELLRRWDLGGRRPDATVLEPEDALELLLGEPDVLRPHPHHDDERNDC